jgi:Uma2 family endonuclease
MTAGTLISLEEYLSTSYSPDKEYCDGVLVERNVGDKAHALLQVALGAYLRRRRKQWQIEAYTELRIRVRPNWYPLPDVCVYTLPAPQERFPSQPPFLWVEILSQDDRMVDVWNKAHELIENGVPNVWIINPNTLESELRTPAGVSQLQDQTLRLADSPIVIPLLAVMDE